MKHFEKWFIIAFVGATLATSCVDDIKFGDAFLEKAPSVAVTQDTISVKRSMLVVFCGILIQSCIMVWPQTGMMWMVR